MSEKSSIPRDVAKMLVQALIEDLWWCTPKDYQDFLAERMTPTVEAGVEIGLILHTRRVLTPSAN